MLALKDSSLNISDEVSYLSSWGANGDGKSLQRVDSKWGTGVPTPGLSNVIELNVSSENNSSIVPALDEAVNQNKISATIISENTAVVGEQISFESNVSDSTGAILKRGKYVWNFGDGNTEENKNGDSVSHAYLYSGDYVAVLDYFQDENSNTPNASVRTTVTVSAPSQIVKNTSDSVPKKTITVAAISSRQKDSGKNIKNSGNNNSDLYNQPAQAVNGFKKSDTNIYFWLMALLALIVASAGSVLFLRKRKVVAKHESDEIEIID